MATVVVSSDIDDRLFLCKGMHVMTYVLLVIIVLMYFGWHMSEKHYKEELKRVTRYHEVASENMRFYKAIAERYEKLMSAMVAGGTYSGWGSCSEAEEALSKFISRVNSVSRPIDHISQHYRDVIASFDVAATYVEDKHAAWKRVG